MFKSIRIAAAVAAALAVAPVVASAASPNACVGLNAIKNFVYCSGLGFSGPVDGGAGSIDSPIAGSGGSSAAPPSSGNSGPTASGPSSTVEDGCTSNLLAPPCI